MVGVSAGYNQKSRDAIKVPNKIWLIVIHFSKKKKNHGVEGISEIVQHSWGISLNLV